MWGSCITFCEEGFWPQDCYFQTVLRVFHFVLFFNSNFACEIQLFLSCSSHWCGERGLYLCVFKHKWLAKFIYIYRHVKSKLYEVKNIYSIELWIIAIPHSNADKQLPSECLDRAQKGLKETGDVENFLSSFLVLKS